MIQCNTSCFTSTSLYMFAVNVMTVAQVVVLVDGLTVADAIVTIVIGFIAPIVFFAVIVVTDIWSKETGCSKAKQ